MLSLDLKRTPLLAPNLYSWFNSELVPVCFGRGLSPSPSGVPFPSGSRTLVTKFSNSPGYRFSPALSAEYPHAPVLQQSHLVAASPLQALPPGNHFPDLFTHASRGHARIAADCSGRRLLLPLCGIAPARRLCEALRFQAICRTLARNEVREATHADAGR